MDYKMIPSTKNVVFMLILFWPAGLFLLFLRFYRGRNKKGFLIVSFLFFICGLINFIILYNTNMEKSANNDLVLLFIGFGIIFLIGAILLHKKESKENSLRVITIATGGLYDAIPKSHPQPDAIPMERSSSSMQEIPDEDVGEDMENERIDHDEQSPLSDNVMPAARFDIRGEQIREPRQRAMRCPYCGGDNVVTEGQVRECKYCGSYISYDME